MGLYRNPHQVREKNFHRLSDWIRTNEIMLPEQARITICGTPSFYLKNLFIRLMIQSSVLNTQPICVVKIFFKYFFYFTDNQLFINTLDYFEHGVRIELTNNSFAVEGSHPCPFNHSGIHAPIV